MFWVSFERLEINFSMVDFLILLCLYSSVILGVNGIVRFLNFLNGNFGLNLILVVLMFGMFFFVR